MSEVHNCIEMRVLGLITTTNIEKKAILGHQIMNQFLKHCTTITFLDPCIT